MTHALLYPVINSVKVPRLTYVQNATRQYGVGPTTVRVTPAHA